jgi:ABC-type multidrug transport system fused ATPase/permease subunit
MGGATVEVELSPEEIEMMDDCDFKDKSKSEEVEKSMTEALKEGAYSRLSAYNTPKCAMITALCAVLVNAVAQPIFGGIIMSRLLVVLSAPPPYLLVLYPDVKPELKVKADADQEKEFASLMTRYTPEQLEEYGLEVCEAKTSFFSIMIVVVAVSVGVAGFIQKYCFSLLGENVTYKVRKELYASILQKNIGWFDMRENSTGVLSSSMASDTAIINGVGGESLGPQIEAFLSLASGLVIGFYYCW